MSQQFPQYNPYASPNALPSQYGPSKPPKPGYLSALCIISLVLGCLGALRGGCVAVSSATGGPPFQRQNQGQQMPPELRAAMEKFEAEGKAIDARYSPINKAMIVLQALIGVAMAIGAVMVLQSKRPGDWVLRGAFAATLLASVVHMVPFTMQMLEMGPLMNKVSEEIKQGGGGQDAAMAQGVIIGISAMMYGGICVAAFWLLIKLGLFGHGIYYLGKPNVQASLD
jgi:hypothetical protein